ncbi:MAG: hypothetical protein ACFWT8_01610 [Lacticaseibacillus casei]
MHFRQRLSAISDLIRNITNDFTRERLEADLPEGTLRLPFRYTETVIGYLRTDLRKDPYAIEQAINDLLTTLTDAQTAGHRVAAFFSDDPQTAADNILKELPRVPAWYLFDQYWPIVMFLFASIIFTMLVGYQEHRLSLSSIADQYWPVAVVFAFIGVPCLLCPRHFIQQSLF